MIQLDYKWLQDNCGIQILTGEAERITPGLRLLCDIRKQGADLIQEWLGVSDIEFHESMNCSFTFGSVMLSRSMIHELCILRGLKLYGEVMELVSGELWVFESLEDRESYKNIALEIPLGASIKSVYKIMNDQPGQGTRCTHQMSGRTV